jgi:hypothetical protein
VSPKVPAIRFVPCSGGTRTMRGRMFSGRPSNSDCNGPLRSLKSVKLAIQPTEYESYGKSSLHSFSCRILLAVSVDDAAALRSQLWCFRRAVGLPDHDGDYPQNMLEGVVRRTSSWPWPAGRSATTGGPDRPWAGESDAGCTAARPRATATPPGMGATPPRPSPSGGWWRRCFAPAGISSAACATGNSG